MKTVSQLMYLANLMANHLRAIDRHDVAEDFLQRAGSFLSFDHAGCDARFDTLVAHLSREGSPWKFIRPVREFISYCDGLVDPSDDIDPVDTSLPNIVRPALGSFGVNDD